MIRTHNLLHGTLTKSCGCLRREMLARQKFNLRHGHSPKGRTSPTYNSWASMLERCLNPKATGYARYGGSGVTVCKRWLKFVNFLADMGLRPAGTSLDRINPAGNYTKRNCRWATPKEQAHNKRAK